MNERIKELAEQADDYTDNKIQQPGEYHPDWHDVRDQKFAELIMRETFNWVVDNVGLMEETEWHSLKKHFGVEE